MLNERPTGFIERICEVDKKPCEGQGTIAECDACNSVQELESRFLDPVGTPPRRITRYRFIHFVETAKKPKTSTWECRNNSSEDRLGTVKWYGPWRQYCFFPETIDGLVFNDVCLKDICHFMSRLRGSK